MVEVGRGGRVGIGMKRRRDRGRVGVKWREGEGKAAEGGETARIERAKRKKRGRKGGRKGQGEG